MLALLLTATILLSQVCQAGSPSGRWRGSWSSQTSGHSGPLRAHIRPSGEGGYRALFVGRFAGVVPFVYPARLERVPGTCNRYRSAQRLPLLGTYRMSAQVYGNQFRASFRGRDDRGTFRMSR